MPCLFMGKKCREEDDSSNNYDACGDCCNHDHSFQDHRITQINSSLPLIHEMEPLWHVKSEEFFPGPYNHYK